MTSTAVRPAPVGVRALHCTLGALWAILTPALLYAAAIASAPFFGELPTAADRATSQRFLLLAAAVGLGLPLVAALLAARRGQGWWFLVGAAAVGGLIILCLATSGAL